MSSINILVIILKAIGWFSIVIGFLFSIFSVLTSFLFSPFEIISILLNGLVLLCLAHGLSKKEKWAWYSGLVVFSLGTFSSIIELFFRVSLFENIFSLLFSIIYFYLLIKEKQIFIEQPKEKISQWLQVPYFVVVITGTVLSYLIIGGFFAYSYLWLPREDVKVAEEKKETEAPRERVPEKVKDTEVIQYIPEEPSGKVYEGFCDTNSFSAQRKDAWRCINDHNISDPCFEFQGKARLVCEPNPITGDKGFLLKPTKPLPEPTLADNFGKGRGWLIELEDGTVCYFITGATGIVDEKRINYDCNDGSNILGDLEVGIIWNALRANLELIEGKWQAKSVELVPIKRVWQ